MKTSATGIISRWVVSWRRYGPGTTLALLSVFLSGSNPACDPLCENCLAEPVLLYVETFSNGRNEGAWALSGRSVIKSSGGAPGAHLRDTALDTFAPRAATQWQKTSAFTGDYRGLGVTGLTVSFRIFAVSNTVADRPMTLMLVSDPDTPGDPGDDIYLFYVGFDNIPLPGAGWVGYAFDVPAHSPTLPRPHSQVEGEPGWVAAKGEVFMPVEDPDAAWNTAMEDVDQVIFWFHDPRYFAIFQLWDVGMDNPSIFVSPDA